MSLILIQHPLKVVDQNIPENSKWSAVWHPVIWKFQRRDKTISSAQEYVGSGGGVQLNFLAQDLTTDITIGELIYVNITDVASGTPYEGSYEVLDCYLSGSDTVVVIDADPTGIGATYSGFINLISDRTFYMIEVAIYKYVNGVKELFSTDYEQYHPASDGSIKIDLQTTLQTLVSAIDGYDYVALSRAARNLGTRYDIKVREYWKEAGTGDWITGDDEPNLDEHYYSHSVKQIREVYGQNMGEFVMFPTDVTYEHNKGKFLTKFETPKYWEGYPFSLGFLYDKSITDAGQRLSSVEALKNINGGAIATTDTIIDDTKENLTHLTLGAIYNNSPYSALTKFVDLYLKGNLIQIEAAALWNIDLNFTSNVQLVDFTNNKTIGNANWSGSLSVLLDDLVTSVNTNTQDGALIDAGFAFDNSLGYSAEKTASIGTYPWDLTVTAPQGSGTAYNGIEIGIIIDAGQWFVDPITQNGYGAFAQDLAGGIDTTSPATGLTTARISEIKTIEISDDCETNPIYLRWLNPLGYFDYWLFHTNNFTNDSISQETIFQKYIEDLGDADTDEYVMSKAIREEISIGATDLNKQQMQGLRYLLSSVFVQMYIPNGAGFIWMTVRVKSGSFAIDEAIETRQGLEIVLSLPKRYNQQQ